MWAQQFTLHLAYRSSSSALLKNHFYEIRWFTIKIQPLLVFANTEFSYPLTVHVLHQLQTCQVE